MKTGTIFAHPATVVADDNPSLGGILQSRLHEQWVREFSSTLEERMRYMPSDSFLTFPFPTNLFDDTEFQKLSSEYFSYRSSLMKSCNEGLTKIYNRFHDPNEVSQSVERLRDLHHSLDVAVLVGYGWNDLAFTATAVFLSEENEQDHRYQGRLFWAAAFRDQVLSRLLNLNAERASEKRRLGLAPPLGSADIETELENVH